MLNLETDELQKQKTILPLSDKKKRLKLQFTKDKLDDGRLERHLPDLMRFDYFFGIQMVRLESMNSFCLVSMIRAAADGIVIWKILLGMHWDQKRWVKCRSLLRYEDRSRNL